MEVKAIAYSYLRRIKAGARQFSNAPEQIKSDILYLALQELNNGKMSQEQYNQLFEEV